MAARTKKIGYAFWGFMADERHRNGKKFSSPDGSTLHSFSIVNAFLDAGYEVYRLMPNRDKEFVDIKGVEAFASFSQKQRWNAYRKFKTLNFIYANTEISVDFPELDVVILEWRMPTVRNSLSMGDINYDPDLYIQNMILSHYRRLGVPIIILDLDYKMTPKDDKNADFVLELGYKRGDKHHFFIPFDIGTIRQIPHELPDNKIVYVGNRYERDEAFNLFFGEDVGRIKNIQYHVYGNWIEGNKDSKERWPHIFFHHRAQPYELRDAYKNSLVTPLLLKDEYNENGFMTVRLLEVLLFGSIPLFPSTFQFRWKYVHDKLIVRDEFDMINFIKALKLNDHVERFRIRAKIIEKLHPHNPHNFLEKVESIIKVK